MEGKVRKSLFGRCRYRRKRIGYRLADAAGESDDAAGGRAAGGGDNTVVIVLDHCLAADSARPPSSPLQASPMLQLPHLLLHLTQTLPDSTPPAGSGPTTSSD
jgi:hypothetical protein